ncbi:Polyferredoxin [Ferrimonas balearica DSM 9799]|uniref:Polyferredoxin n=1 Tax=Ferrimonas balearica (strain DSM 9799 / CCM 4581 / KCTC 23876 / PAT) TaxID=550540 RepID=E1SRS9_FERBD|nr:4Fe-4S binding protein [Ferrimonas balearica]ADN74898.1 Polyferredoxin [Ferrimonas balearica DSM 9799]
MANREAKAPAQPRRWIAPLQWTVVTLFLMLLVLGWGWPEQADGVVRAAFWGLFWPLLTVLTLVLFGPLFCGVCPLGTLGRWVSRRGRQARLPRRWLWAGTSLLTLLLSYWLVDSITGGYGRLPLVATLVFFTGYLLVCLALSWAYRDAPFCRSVCPFALLAKTMGRLAPLRPYRSAARCGDCCHTRCLKACPSCLTVPTDRERLRHNDCNLCLACVSACREVKLAPRWPRTLKGAARLQAVVNMTPVQGWGIVLLSALVVVGSQLEHRWDRSVLHPLLPWNRLAEWSGGGASVWLMLFTLGLTLAWTGLALWGVQRASGHPWRQLGPAMAATGLPLLLCLLLSHGLVAFILRGAPQLWAGVTELMPGQWAPWPWTPSRGSPWMVGLASLVWLGVGWSTLLAWRLAGTLIRGEAFRWQQVSLWLGLNAMVWLFLLLRMVGVALPAAGQAACH